MEQRMHAGRPAVSVNTALAHQFPQYLRATIENFQPCHSFLFYPQQHLALRPQGVTLRPNSTQHPAPPPYRKSLASMNAAASNRQPLAPGYTEADAKAFFAMTFDEDTLGAPGTHQPFVRTFGHHTHLPFRPVAPPYGSPAFGPPIIPAKVETEPPAGIVPTLMTNVNPAQYSPVSLDECINTPVEYCSTSPSSVDTTGMSPLTPGVHGHDTFFDYDFCKEHPDHAYPAFGAPTYGTHQHGSFSSDASSFSSSHNPAFHQAQEHFQPLNQPHGLAITYPLAHQHAHPEIYHRQASASPTEMFSDAVPELSGNEEDEDDEGDEDDRGSSDVFASSSTSSSGGHTINKQDQYLLDMRARGHTYKQIKSMGNFREAESTLRGRVRVLTKDKHQRVRKPVWHHSDIALLRRAVREVTRSSPSNARRGSTTKVGWLKVSDWMKDHGSTYPFAPATCAKKWSKL